MGVPSYRRRIRQVADILDRNTKVKLVFATLASVVLATLDTLAISLVLPLVNMAAGQESLPAHLDWLVPLLGTADHDRVVLVLAIGVVSLFILKDLGALAYAWWIAGFKAHNRVSTSSQLLRLFLTAPYTDVSRRSTSELIRTMIDAVSQFYGSVIYSLMALITSLISILGILVALLLTAPVPTLLLAVYLGLAAVLYLKVMKPKSRRAGRTSADASRAAWRTALAALGGLKETRLRGSQQYFVDRYTEAATRGARAGRVAEFIGAMPRYLLEILFILAVGLILGLSVIDGGSSSLAANLGLLALFVAAGFRVLPAVTGLLSSVGSLRFGVSYLDLIHDEIRHAGHLALAGPADKRLPFRQELHLRNISFTYPGTPEPALKDVTLSVPRGQTVALVGGSGAGKTTLVDIILGLHEPAAGEMSVDGQRVKDDLSAWQANIGYVPQEVFLLDGTLAENIAFDKDPHEIDRDLLFQAVKRAQLESVVDQLPDGVDSYIGERGSRLSGGQRQRVGIARALYRQPEILVLDEATSALDNETEHRISQAVQELAGSLTLVIVAHRLSTVRAADKMVLMSQGRVVAEGPFDVLRSQNPEFERLVQLGSLA